MYAHINGDGDCPSTNRQFGGQHWYFDHRRQMWVCKECGRPPYDEFYCPTCIWCGEEFTLDTYSKKAWANATCRNCGGENVATDASATSYKEAPAIPYRPYPIFKDNWNYPPKE